VLDRGQIEFMKDEYYRLRGWDIAAGFQTVSKLKELGLDDVANWLTELNLTR
jgi:aldehyde:ferredoxin oxidoreductase